MYTLNFRRPVEVQSFSEACFLFPNFVLRTNVVRNVCYICIRWASYLENANGSINLQSAVSGNDYTVKFSKAIQSCYV